MSNGQGTASRKGPERQRPRKSGRGKTHRLSRPVMIAVALAVLGAAFLFWPRGGGSTRGVGERYSVVTAQGNTAGAPLAEPPQSGEVQIEQETRPLVSERPAGAADTPPAPVQRATGRTSSPPPDTIADEGAWALQLAAFRNRDNAVRLLEELQDKGYKPQLQAGRTPGGADLYKVWLVHFASQQEAAAFADERPADLGEAIPVRR